MKNLDAAYTDPEIAGKQRAVVDAQLLEMRAGKPPKHFDILGRMFADLKLDTGLPCVTVLDAGCGSAYYSEIIEHYVPGWMAEYRGVDFNDGMIDMARTCYPDLEISFGDLRELGAFGNESYDIVLSGATIIHIAEWQEAVREIARVAGRFLILHRTRIRNHPAPPGYKIDVAHHYDTDVYYLQFDEPHLCRFVEALGLRTVKQVPTGETNYLTLLFERTQAGRKEENEQHKVRRAVRC